MYSDAVRTEAVDQQSGKKYPTARLHDKNQAHSITWEFPATDDSLHLMLFFVLLNVMLFISFISSSPDFSTIQYQPVKEACHSAQTVLVPVALQNN